MPNTPTLAEVLAAGNEVPSDGSIAGPNGSLITFGADGRITLSAGQATVELSPSGQIDVGNVNGAVISLTEAGSIYAHVSGGGYVELVPNGELALRGHAGQIIVALPDTDPHVEGRLYSENGTVKVSAG